MSTTGGCSLRLNHSIPFLLLSLLITPHYSQRLDVKVPKWALNNFHSVSTKAPITRHLLSQPTYSASMYTIISHIYNVEAAILKQLRTENPNKPDQILRICNAREIGHVKGVTTVFRNRGLPDPQAGCVTIHSDDRLFQNEQPRITLKHLVGAVHDKFRVEGENSVWVRDNVLLPWAAKFPKGPLSNWSGVSPSSGNFPWARGSKRCLVSAVGLIRIGSLWHADIMYTNARKTDSLAKGKRQYLEEYVHLSDAHGSNFSMLQQITPLYLNETAIGARVFNSTTRFTRFSGKAKPSKFQALHVEDNYALLDAVEKADLGVQQGDDALTSSNLAVLLLPLSLNLVPISLISHVGSTKMLWYILLSDVLTVIPLAIKGIELVVLGRTRFESVLVRISTSSNGTLGEAAAGELWAASCRAKESILSAGVVFICLAIAFLVGGVVAELWAADYSKRRRMREAMLQAEIEKVYMQVQSDEHYDDNAYIATMRLKETSAA